MTDIIKRMTFSFRLCLSRLIRAKTVGVRAIVVRNKSEILLVKHTYRDGWHTPGGGIESGETPLEAISRELFEEVGITIKAKPMLFSVYLNKWQGLDDYPILYIVHHFEEGQSNSPEIDQKRWFSVSELPDDITDNTRTRLNEYFNSTEPSSRW